MSIERPVSREPFLSRWSRRKLAAAREAAPPEPAQALPTTSAPIEAAGEPGAAASAGASPEAPAPAPVAPPALPSVEALTFESDFSAFLKPGVAPDVQRAALRKLLHDPRFNVMDGLDVYIDDYTKPSPLDPAIARMLADAQNLFVPRADAASEASKARDASGEERAAGHGAPVPPDEAPLDAAQGIAASPSSPPAATDAREGDVQAWPTERRIAREAGQAGAQDDVDGARPVETRS